MHINFRCQASCFPARCCSQHGMESGSCALIHQIFVIMSSPARIPRMIHRTAAQFYCNNFFYFYQSKRIIASVTVLLHPPSFVASLCRHIVVNNVISRCPVIGPLKISEGTARKHTSRWYNMIYYMSSDDRDCNQFGTTVPSIRYNTPFCASFIPIMRTPSSKVTRIHSGESGLVLETGLKVTSFPSCSVSYETGISDKEIREGMMWAETHRSTFLLELSSNSCSDIPIRGSTGSGPWCGLCASAMTALFVGTSIVNQTDSEENLDDNSVSRAYE